ncbi:MAG: amidohydrolase family protein, partial [Alphaproteobacteria bacterium]|nr:amidohydrolase family protein [Alphaproteobacteria bacterium]
RADVYCANGTIQAIGENLSAGSAETIDGRAKLVMPGLTNAHVHSWEAMYKGRYDNLPLELWMLLCYPILGAVPLPPRLIYLRTMIVGMECLKTGVTNVLDDVIEMPGQDLDQLEAIFQAYDDLGIRANVSGHIINRPFSETIPFTDELLPDDLKAKVSAAAPPSTQTFIDLAEEAVSRFHNKKGRPRTAIAHSIWVTDEDIRMIADAGSTIIHNAISNQKLSVGIMPYRKIMDAGITIDLGSDDISTSDTPRIFDAMRAAGHLHNVTTADYDSWLSAHEVMHMATLGGAYSALLEDQIGSLEIGKKADLVIMDLSNANFVPLNDARKHLIYCENGSSVETVIVDGETVVRDGLLTKVDENALLDEFRALWPELLAKHEPQEERNQAFIPYFQEVYKRCAAVDLGIHRYGGANMPKWP